MTNIEREKLQMSLQEIKIKKIIKKPFKGKVYNFGCIPDNNYFANNILVHN